MSVDRYLDPAVAEGLKRQADDVVETFESVGPWIEVLFPAAATARDIQHGLGVVPSGYEIILEVGGHVRAANIMDWSTEIAYLQADNANTRARLRFVLVREDFTDA